MKVYISGKITSLDLEEAKAKFKKIEMSLLSDGIDSVNQMEKAPYDTKKDWKDYMSEDIRALFDCDAIRVKLFNNEDRLFSDTLPKMSRNLGL